MCTRIEISPELFMYLYKIDRKIDNHCFEYYSYFCKLELKGQYFYPDRPEDINTDHLLLYINNDALLQGDFEVMIWENYCRTFFPSESLGQAASIPAQLNQALSPSLGDNSNTSAFFDSTFMYICLSLDSAQKKILPMKQQLYLNCASPQNSHHSLGARVGRLYREGRLRQEAPFSVLLGNPISQGQDNWNK